MRQPLKAERLRHFLATLKTSVIDVAATILFLVWLIRVVVHEIGFLTK